MGSLSIWHWLIVLAVVLIVFGTKKLRGAGGDLGSAVKSFKDAMKEGADSANNKPESVAAQSQAVPTETKKENV